MRTMNFEEAICKYAIHCGLNGLVVNMPFKSSSDDVDGAWHLINLANCLFAKVDCATGDVSIVDS